MATKPVSEAPGAVKANPEPNQVKRVFGWRPQVPDQRDRVFKLLDVVIPPLLPAKVDLTSLMPPVVDQGRIGSCVANAVAVAIQFLRRKEGKAPDFLSSRLFNYYNTRVMEKSIQFDAGAIIRDAIKVINAYGAPREYSWQYKDTPPDSVTNMWKSTDKPRKKPGASPFKQGLEKQAVAYEVVPRNLATVKTCLAAGFPIVFGFAVYDSFLTDAVATTGTVPLPKPSEQMIGGHAVLAIGYDDATQRILCRNSWGTGWGDKGNFTLPYAYMIDMGLADDFWTIRSSE